MSKFIIYKFTSKTTDKSYIGLTGNPKSRYCDHKRAVGDCDIITIIKDSCSNRTAAEKYGIQPSVVSSIRSGKYSKSKGLDINPSEYYDKESNCISDDLANKIILDHCSHADANKKYNTTRALAIRSGKVKKHLDRSHAPKYKNGREKITEELVKCIIFDSCPNTEAAKKYDVHFGLVSKIRLNQRWKHIDRTDAPKYKRSSKKTKFKTYIGKPCNHGHTIRYSSNNSCVSCNKNRVISKEYHAEYQHNYKIITTDKIIKMLEDPDEIYFIKEYRKRKIIERATPNWCCPASVRHIYSECVRLSDQMGLEFEVDHMIPIHNKKVCGLHVPENLKVVSHSLNRIKGNKFNADAASKEL